MTIPAAFRPALFLLALPALAAGPWTVPPGLVLRAEEASFAGTLSAPGRTSSVGSDMSVSREKDTWVLRELARMSTGGETLEMTVVDANGAVRNRSAQQGETRTSLAYGQGRVKGSTSSEGAQDAIDVDLGGEAFADGACAGVVLAALPLGEGYQTEFRSLNLRARKAVTKRLRVEGRETLTTPAGTFKTWKAVVTNANGEPGSTTVWSEEGTRRLVKYEFHIAVGNAELVVVQERQPDPVSSRK